MKVYRIMSMGELGDMYTQFARKGFAVPSKAQSHWGAKNDFGYKKTKKHFWFFRSMEDAAKAWAALDTDRDTLVEFELDKDILYFGTGDYGEKCHECITDKIPAYALTGKFYTCIMDGEYDNYGCWHNYCIGWKDII